MHSKDLVATEHIGHSLRYVVMFLWIFLGFLYFSLFSQWFTINWRNRVLVEYLLPWASRRT
jgi:hypothetical protein